jgi:hypothetical protein
MKRVGYPALILGILLAACGGNAQPTIITLEPPTETYTAEALPTTGSAAGMGIVTATPVPTHQPVTPTPGPSPTNPLAPTLSPAPRTLTVTRVPTLAGLRIEYFTTDSEYATPGENVTLFWSVRGADRARIFRLDDENERIYRWDVSAAGQLTVSTRADDREVARFLLTAEVTGSTVEQPLLIPLKCPEVWFFDPAPDACPSGGPEISTQVEQTFERGRMIWVGSQDRIYVIFEDDDSPGWAQYPDNFEEGEPEYDESLVPPPGLIQPVRGFGLIWRSNSRVQDRLGWATTPEVPFEGMFQSDSIEPSVATLYLRMRDGGILALNGLTNEWDMLPPTTEDSATVSQ